LRGGPFLSFYLDFLFCCSSGRRRAILAALHFITSPAVFNQIQIMIEYGAGLAAAAELRPFQHCAEKPTG